MAEIVDPRVIESLSRRYIDAYRVARFVVAVGNFFKIVGIVLAAVIGAGTLVVVGQISDEHQQVATLIGGAAIACFAGALLFLLGVLVASVGQIQKATLDSAVNSSPFLRNQHRVRIMSLGASMLEEAKANTASLDNEMSLPASTLEEAKANAASLDNEWSDPY
jgi:hypothetical protein